MPINMKLLVKISEHKVEEVTISDSLRAFCRVSDYLNVYRYFEKDVAQEKIPINMKLLMKVSERKVGEVKISNSLRAFCRVSK